ncbi:hypothetical protein EJ73_00698 [Hoylesella shahii DSM 15611 = JCM 12083]|uniref:Uncharacterized protein n=1 Tax=Hoylesella shahii DSM 15611 = JCM 12083 TaxID=1122991 RepID=A0A318HY12_9BACT|nr:hypothetical protein EJ73_00698 [Hoylesella shahii DSM 15611 = JCM 12083]
MWEVRNRDTVNALRSSQADIVYPYNGIVYQTSAILRRYYLNTKDIKVLYKKNNMLYLNSAVFFLVRKFYMLRCLLGALYFDMRRFGVFWVFSKHKIPRPNQWGSMKNHKK